MLTLLSALTAVIDAIGRLGAWWRDRGLIDAGKAEANADALAEASRAATAAQAAATDQTRQANADPTDAAFDPDFFRKD
jgi:hypothetical protein